MTERVSQIRTIQRTGVAENPVLLGFARNWLLSSISKEKLQFSQVGYDGFPTVKRNAYASMLKLGGIAKVDLCFRPYMRIVIYGLRCFQGIWRQIRMRAKAFILPHTQYGR